MIFEENWFCHQVGTVHRLQKNLKCCVLLLAVALSVCLVENCLAQTTDSSPANSKVIATKLSGFGVPFKINSEDSTYIEVQLYLSRDLERLGASMAAKTRTPKSFASKRMQTVSIGFR